MIHEYENIRQDCPFQGVHFVNNQYQSLAGGLPSYVVGALLKNGTNFNIICAYENIGQDYLFEDVKIKLYMVLVST